MPRELDEMMARENDWPGPPVKLEDTVAKFREWLLLPDVTPVYATLGAYAGNLLPGDPVWLGLIAPPSSAKTEILNALSRLPDIYPATTISEPALLSGTPRKETPAGAKGGLLREIGDFGVIVFKDFGSILSMRHESKAETIAALREIYDGGWTRHVGADGGRTLSWQGKVGLIFGCTPVLDSHHAVMGAMGERFMLCRCEESDEEQAFRSFEHIGEQTKRMRAELANAVAALFAGGRKDPRLPTDNEKRKIARLAALAVRIRSTVERDRQTREIELVHGAEGPARLALALERLLAGLDTIGADRDTAFAVIQRVALDSVPVQRRRVLEQLHTHAGPGETKTVAEALDLPTSTVRRTLEDLNAYQLVQRTGKEGNADVWTLTTWAAERLPDSVPATSSPLYKNPEPAEEEFAGTESMAAEEEHDEPLF